MGKKSDKFKPQNQGHERQTGSRSLNTNKQRERNLCFSYQYFDRNQGQRFEEWDEADLLLKLNNKLLEISSLTASQAKTQQIIKSYRTLPPKSNFTRPGHVPSDVVWCSMHIQGKECVIGFMEDFVFHVVFLDMNHEFWISEKKNT